MLPLDLSKAPPRSPWEKLDGLMMMPRTIDKLRAKLPGGVTGMYLTHIGVTQALLKIIGIDEPALLLVIGAADSEEEVAAWLAEHAQKSRYEMANQILSKATSADVSGELAEIFEGFYAGRDPSMVNVFDILVWDDRRNFAVEEKTPAG